MEISSIKFYANIPGRTQASATYFAVGEMTGAKRIEALSVEVSAGPQSLLSITQTTNDQEVTVFIYQLADVMGRIEVKK